MYKGGKGEQEVPQPTLGTSFWKKWSKVENSESCQHWTNWPGIRWTEQGECKGDTDMIKHCTLIEADETRQGWCPRKKWHGDVKVFWPVQNIRKHHLLRFNGRFTGEPGIVSFPSVFCLYLLQIRTACDQWDMFDVLPDTNQQCQNTEGNTEQWPTNSDLASTFLHPPPDFWQKKQSVSEWAVA